MRFPRWLSGILIVLLLLVLAAAAFVWYKVASLKTELVESLGRSLHARVEVASLSLDLWQGELHAAGVVLTNERPSAPWDRGEISQATVKFSLRDLLSPVFPLSVDVGAWKLALRPAQGTTDAAESDSAPDAAHPGSSKSKIEVTQLTAQQGEVEYDLDEERHFLFHGVAFEAQDNGAGVWNTQLRADSIEAGSFAAGASSVVLRSDSAKIDFSSLHLQCAGGAITGDGGMTLNAVHAAHATLNAVDVPVVMLVAVQWQMKLAGLAGGRLTYQSDEHGAQATGQISVNHGKFNILPFLGKMASLVGLPDISGVEVDQATTDFAWQNRVLHLTNIDVRKNDVTRIAGSVDVDAAGQVDGHLKLGLPLSLLARWPQLQSGVFNVTYDDYGWADVHLTGTPDHLKEDLSSRVIAAGIEGGNGLINSSTQKAIDVLKGLLGH
jgi:hypothetical protein